MGPVKHKGLYQGYGQTSVHLLIGLSQMHKQWRACRLCQVHKQWSTCGLFQMHRPSWTEPLNYMVQTTFGVHLSWETILPLSTWWLHVADSVVSSVIIIIKKRTYSKIYMFRPVLLISCVFWIILHHCHHRYHLNQLQCLLLFLLWYVIQFPRIIPFYVFTIHRKMIYIF